MHKELYATRRYYKLIDFYRHKTVEGYTEGHHIVPRCMGGSDDEYNIVRLPAKAHYIAHLLLTKMYPDDRSLLSAFACMQRDPKGGRYRVFRAAQYDKMRQASAAASGYKVVIDGIEFLSVNQASKHFGVDWTVIQRWVEKFDGASQSKEDVVIDGVEFPSVNAAARHYGVSFHVITRWIKKFGGVSQPLQTSEAKYKKCVIDGIEFPSQAAAAKHFGITPQAIRHRLKKQKNKITK